jgi:hypothetical protein
MIRQLYRVDEYSNRSKWAIATIDSEFIAGLTVSVLTSSMATLERVEFDCFDICSSQHPSEESSSPLSGLPGDQSLDPVDDDPGNVVF